MVPSPCDSQVPIMALTATATPRVQEEVISNLELRNPFVAKTSFNRPNLHYSVGWLGIGLGSLAYLMCFACADVLLG